ncbi:MAG TPA: ATP-binding cassette domain-containing protein [Polyangiaceae bacterium]|nr:ATP-binding cassette domain-containing protein [Polyangiaceae bacterium]
MAQTIATASGERGNGPLFELRDVWKSFGSTAVLRGVDLQLGRGESLGIIGPSGAGKSVLLKCMVGLLPIDRGELSFDGKSVPDMRSEEQTRLRQRVGFLFQAGVLFDSMTVRENLEFALHEQFFRTMNAEQIEERIAWALEVVGLPPTEAANMPEDLSGGMRKRVGIARTIITKPEVVLYDSPTEGLDPQNAHRISDLIRDLRTTQGITSVVVSHDLRTVFTVCHRVAFLQDGRILGTGSPASLADSGRAEVRDFIIGHPPEEPLDPRESQAPEPWKDR